MPGSPTSSAPRAATSVRCAPGLLRPGCRNGTPLRQRGCLGRRGPAPAVVAAISRQRFARGVKGCGSYQTARSMAVFRTPWWRTRDVHQTRDPHETRWRLHRRPTDSCAAVSTRRFLRQEATTLHTASEALPGDRGDHRRAGPRLPKHLAAAVVSRSDTLAGEVLAHIGTEVAASAPSSSDARHSVAAHNRPRGGFDQP